jgi:hypothetical protein
MSGVRGAERPPGQASGGAEGGECRLDAAAGDLEEASNQMEQHCCCRLDL